jgi:hypothetical protein
VKIGLRTFLMKSSESELLSGFFSFPCSIFQGDDGYYDYDGMEVLHCLDDKKIVGFFVFLKYL